METRAGYKSTIFFDSFLYEILAFPIIYGEGKEAFPLGNYDVEIHMPDGSWLKTDFYPESDDLFSVELEPGLADLLSSKLIKFSCHDLSTN